ncbi:MAG: helix-hairpin-helix domain-containing protein [Candidatus Omnitrophica bacterium]|nr:helix-hairpin-helix domain-containing protein [Candidatus Omnitrophota bacterium]
MFYLTPQERKFIATIIIIFIAGASVQLLFKRDIAPVRWFKSVRSFKININSARADQLQMLPGIGVKLAGRIIDYRNQSGPFKSLEDLENVDGLTAKRFEHIKGLIEL